jgi:hypothetical protein
MRVAIIAIAKCENLYINEWIDYHLHIGFDNIIICDNDDTFILKDIISNPKVILEDFTNVCGVQLPAYRQTFAKYKSDYDWIFFIDIDEFLVLETHTNVKDFLSSYSEDTQVINLCWKHFNDNDTLDVVDNDYSVFTRFKTPVKTVDDNLVKSFVSTSIPDEAVKWICQHNVFYHRLKSIDVLNNPLNGKYIKSPIYEKAWINHYPTKTIGEYVRQKYFRGGPNRNNVKYCSLHHFFKYNTYTKEKEDYAMNLINSIKQHL